MNKFGPKLSPEERAEISAMSTLKGRGAILARRLGVCYDTVKRVWLTSHASARRCDCGNPGYRMSSSGLCCERCWKLQRQADEQEAACHQQKRIAGERVWWKYVEPYAASGFKFRG